MNGGARRRTWSTVGLGTVALVGLVVVAAPFIGGADTGEFVAEDPCTAAPDPFPGDGLDAAVQRIALSALNGAACELGTTRERLVLSLDPNGSFDDVEWDRATMEDAAPRRLPPGDRRRQRSRRHSRLGGGHAGLCR